MNKILEIIIATLGAFNKVMSVFIPLAIALLILVVFGNEISNTNITILLIVSGMSALFRAIDMWID